MIRRHAVHIHKFMLCNRVYDAIVLRGRNVVKIFCVLIHPNAVVTPLRKAASYEQRKTNLGNQNFRRRIITYSATYYAALTRVYSLPPRIGDTTVESADFTWQNFQMASRRPRNYHT